MVNGQIRFTSSFNLNELVNPNLQDQLFLDYLLEVTETSQTLLSFVAKNSAGLKEIRSSSDPLDCSPASWPSV